MHSTSSADADRDSYQNSSDSQDACTAPTGYVADNTDCDDSDSAINPGASEVCDGIDNDYKTSLEDGVQTPRYTDAHSDGYRDANHPKDACTASTDYVT